MLLRMALDTAALVPPSTNGCRIDLPEATSDLRGRDPACGSQLCLGLAPSRGQPHMAPIGGISLAFSGPCDLGAGSSPRHAALSNTRCRARASQCWPCTEQGVATIRASSWP